MLRLPTIGKQALVMNDALLSAKFVGTNNFSDNIKGKKKSRVMKHMYFEILTQEVMMLMFGLNMLARRNMTRPAQILK